MEKLKDEDFLTLELGFKRVDNDDFSGHWLSKAIKHDYLTNCRIMIDTIKDSQFIFLSCKDLDCYPKDVECTVYQANYSKKKLTYLLNFLKT